MACNWSRGLRVLGFGSIVLGQCVLSAAGADEAARQPASRSAPEINVPEGFTIEQVAGPPLVERPMMASFDERGRLFVCDSSGFNLTGAKRADELIKNPPHAIRVLEDTDGDGRFDKSTLFADKMTFPMGALWHEGALYVASPPHLWRLEDTDGDGVADRRHEFVTKFGFVGNACDIHGPFLGPDGRIYWANCQRAFAIKRPDGSLLEGKAAGVFRIRPDGNDVEMLCAGGFDNPVEIAFTDEGEAFATVDLFIGSPRPRLDAIIHCVEGGVFPYGRLDPSFKRTGELLPAMIELGWVAPAGLMRYRGDALGNGYRDNLFSAQFNTRRVVRHVVERAGATFRGQTEDFLVSPDTDFHPTDVMEDADGSLLVVDTGGWFVRGCPTSQIAKPNVYGAIYRVRRRGASQTADPRGLQIDFGKLAIDELRPLLGDARWVVRDRAVLELARRGADAIGMLTATLRSDPSVLASRNALWALTRSSDAHARAAIREALGHSNESVRLSAVTAVGLWRDAAALDDLKRLAVADDMPAVRREAATALGRIGRSDAVPALLDALRAGGDRFLQHAQIYALIRIGDREATLAGLADAAPRVRGAALLALDQMENGNLTRNDVVPLLESADADLERTALAVVVSRREWAGDVADLLRRKLDGPELSEGDQGLVKAALLALCREQAIQAVVADTLHAASTTERVRRLLMEVISESSVRTLPSRWNDELRRCLNASDEQVVLQAVNTVRTRNVSTFDADLLRLALDESQSPALRLAALGAVAPRLDTVVPALVEFLQRELNSGSSSLTRLAAASALGNLRLDDSQLEELMAAVAAAGAIELPYLLAAFERSHNPQVGKNLVAALEKSPGVANFSPDAMRHVIGAYPPEVAHAAAPLLERLQAAFANQGARLVELQAVLSGGDWIKGRAIFQGAKASCSACHAIKSMGGKIGPDLSKIGNIRTPRDLLESIVLPSSSIARGYEAYTVVTKGGKAFSGNLVSDLPDALTLVTTERTEIRVLRSDIDEVEPSRVSIMPQGLDTLLSRQELADLIAYLMSLK